VLAEEALGLVVVRLLGVVTDGALEGLVAYATASAAVLGLLAVPVVFAVVLKRMCLEGGNIGDAVLVFASGFLASVVSHEASGVSSGVCSGVCGGEGGGEGGSGVRSGVAGAAAATAVVEKTTATAAVVKETATAATVVEETTATTAGVKETTATAAPLSSLGGLFFKVGGFGEAAVAACVEGAIVDTEGVHDTRTAGVATAVGGTLVGAVVACSTSGGSTSSTVTSYASVCRA